MYLCTEIFERLDKYAYLFEGTQALKTIASNLQKTLKPFHVKVKIHQDNTLERNQFAIGGEYHYDKVNQPIHLHLNFPPGVTSFTWKGHWKHFRFLAGQVLQHELIHQHQCQFPEHNEGNYYDMNTDNKDINYFSEFDEIDTHGHDIAMEIRYYYPDEDPYEVLKTVSKRKKIHSYKYYTKAFKGRDWTEIRKRLIKKAHNWIPYTHI